MRANLFVIQNIEGYLMMRIKKLLIKNYKIFDEITIDNMNKNMNIFIGQNNSGKTTILEAIQLVLTSKLNGYSIMQRITCDWFNKTCREKYIKEIAQGEQKAFPPEILIEAYFFDDESNESSIKKTKGTNNSLKEDSLGIGIKIKLDEEYNEIYYEYVRENKISDIPIELYQVEWKAFSGSDIKLYKAFSNKVGIIDTTKKDFYLNTNKFLPNGISNLLDDTSNKKIELEYKNMKDKFNKDIIRIIPIEQDLQNESNIKFNLKEDNVGKWNDELSLIINGMPFECNGIGNQNLIKSELFVKQNKDINILLVEEPENNLTYTNMHKFINILSDQNDKQMFISTHSSFISSKLGLKNLILLSSSNEIKTFKDLDDDTNKFFIKLPNYNVLRLILSNRTILVEGPSDDLIIQRAYHDKYNKYPIEDMIDIMSANGISFKRYCELAKLIKKDIIVVTDNDKKYKNKKEEFDNFGCVKSYMEEKDELNTLEPSLIHANKVDGQITDTFKEIIYSSKKSKNIKTKNEEEVLRFMTDHKTEYSFNIFTNENQIKYPKYINDLIEYLSLQKNKTNE